MRLKFFFSTLALMMVLFAVAANAQPAVTATSEAPKAEPVKVSGTMYLEWLKTMENRQEGENYNTFRIQRVYLDFKKKIDDVWSARATLDVGNDNGSADSRYQAYIKYAYLQGAFDFGFGTLTTQFGMIGTPVIGHIDNQSDYRWLNQNYLDAAKALLFKHGNTNVTGAAPGQSIDNSADLGLSLSLKVASMITITGAITNGEGYKKTDEMAEGDDGKAMYAMLTVTPIGGLFLSGFYMNRTTDDAESGDNYINYYGANAIYVFQGIRLGVSYVMAKVSTMDVGDLEAEVSEYTLLDVFIMANLKSFTGIPVLLAGRYAMGSTEYAEGYTVANGSAAEYNGFKSDVVIWAIGVGYQVNDNVRFMAYLEDVSSSSSDITAREWDNSNRNFYVKAEAKF